MNCLSMTLVARCSLKHVIDEIAADERECQGQTIYRVIGKKNVNGALENQRQSF
jgi:hypothetical protein